jgi:required for meiotic nuclear division protein 1
VADRSAEPRVEGEVTVVMAMRALLLADRIDTRALERKEAIGTGPLTLPLGEGGIAVLFRYGAAVLFDVSPAAQERFLA